MTKRTRLTDSTKQSKRAQRDRDAKLVARLFADQRQPRAEPDDIFDLQRVLLWRLVAATGQMSASISQLADVMCTICDRMESIEHTIQRLGYEAHGARTLQ